MKKTIFDDIWLLTSDEYAKENIFIHSGDSLKRKRHPLEDYFQNNITNVQHKNRVQKAIDENKYEDAIKNGLITRERANLIIKSAKLNNPNVRYADGGEVGQEIKCRRCGWQWNTKDSEEFDKYVCHNCGFDNRMYYDKNPIGMKDGGEILKGGRADRRTIREIADFHNVKYDVVFKQYKKGIKHELEHTSNFNIAKEIAKDHLYEMPDYYDMLEKIEKTFIYNIGGL
jgi:ribosomal protein L37E